MNEAKTTAHPHPPSGGTGTPKKVFNSFITSNFYFLSEIFILGILYLLTSSFCEGKLPSPFLVLILPLPQVTDRH